MKISTIFGAVAALPSQPYFNATQQLEDAHINPMLLIGTRNNRTPDYVGPRLADKWETMGKLYSKFTTNGRLSQAEMREFGMVRKLLQLAHLVRATQNNEYLFERYCFYGCHCLPGLPSHDSTAGSGKPVDEIDGTCSHLRQCYLCAKQETEGECDGTTMSHGYSFGLLDYDNDGKTDDIECNNTEGSCRWKLCQCDRQYALQLREHEQKYNEKFSIGNDGDGFDREGECQTGVGGESEKSCCGNYENNFRLIFNKDTQECCDNDRTIIKPYGECENPSA